MDLLKQASRQGQTPNPAELLAAIPFCRHLGLRPEVGQGELVLVMPFAPHLIGNATLPALHGGVIGAFLETAAIAQIIWELGGGHLPKPIDISIDYLRSGRAVETRARAHIAKRGRRVVNVHGELWQDDPEKPIATLRGHFLLGSEPNRLP
jgi:uncharacterized protein (TIGR00369 family)